MQSISMQIQSILCITATVVCFPGLESQYNSAQGKASSNQSGQVQRILLPLNCSPEGSNLELET